MRRFFSLPLLLIALFGAAMAQQERTATAGPGAPHPDAPALADAAGVYERGAGLVLPRFLDPVTVSYPGSAPVPAPPLNCIISLVVGVDGAAAEAKVVRSLVPQVDSRAIRELLRARYEPAKLDGKPVPMRVLARIHFMVGEDMATPRLTWADTGSGNDGEPQQGRKWDTPPKVLHSVEAEFPEKALRVKAQGEVLLSFVVGKDGLPKGIQVERSVGMGMDEQAFQALKQYRFEPATKDGVAIDAPLTIAISFRLR